MKRQPALNCDATITHLYFQSLQLCNLLKPNERIRRCTTKERIKLQSIEKYEYRKAFPLSYETIYFSKDEGYTFYIKRRLHDFKEI